MSANIPPATARSQSSAPVRMAAPTQTGAEAADMFKSVLARAAKDGAIKDGVGKKAVRQEKDVEDQAPVAPFNAAPLPVHQAPSKDQDRRRAQDDKATEAPGQAMPHSDRDASTSAARPLSGGAAAADAAAFEALVHRLDAGRAPSASTHLTLPGDQWRAEQVQIHAQAGSLSVQIDLGSQSDGRDEALKQLEARLRARGLDATVSDSEASRIADPANRIA
jgi:hypothetical protein